MSIVFEKLKFVGYHKKTEYFCRYLTKKGTYTQKYVPYISKVV